MTIKLLLIAKTNNPQLQTLCEEYTKRLKHYTDFRIEVLSFPKKKRFNTEAIQKKEEGKILLEQLTAGDFVILLDERGKEMTSTGFADLVAKKQIQSVRRLVFIIGGPYGVSKEVFDRANLTMALSKMTFSHQMVRVIFVEQLYRAYTIIKGESYHH
jgi:23S rRNA (pseudouridine1915-N3)-methyltransferase